MLYKTDKHKQSYMRLIGLTTSWDNFKWRFNLGPNIANNIWVMYVDSLGNK